jgi:prepilin signal peptidase PulO-like enzyme (type II secretory pathway)
MIFLIFFIIGLLIGSFLNVVVYRISVAETLLGRSYCPHCRTQVAWYDNIPLVSFILLKFRCRYCQKAISWQYPLVEFFTGFLFLWVGMKFFNPLDVSSYLTTGYFLTVVSFFVVIFVYDVLFMEIPSIALWPAVGLAVGYNLLMDGMASPNASGGSGIWGSLTYSGTLAAFAAFMFFFLLVSVSKEKWMGMGDALLVIFLGLVLGWPQILMALFLAFTIGAVYGIILIASRVKNMKSQVPFAPFLIIGSVIALFFYTPIIQWYSRLFIFN